MCKFVHDFSTGIPLNLLIIYGKEPNFKGCIYLAFCLVLKPELVFNSVVLLI